jgi:hypothetical protein
MKHRFAKFVFGVFTFALTAFVFANTYEVLYNKDVAFAQSVTKVSNQQVINSAIEDFAAKISTDEQNPATPMIGLNEIRIPALEANVKIEESRLANGEWYKRPSVAHSIGLNKDTFGTTVDYMLYASKSWRTFPDPNSIEKGMEVLIEHDKATSAFTVGEKRILPFDRALLVSKTEARQVLLVIEDPSSQVYYGFSLVSEAN